MAEINQKQKQSRPAMHPSVIQMRLDTSELKNRIRRYLEGKHIEYKVDKENVDVQEVEVSDGERKCNEKGVQAIMSFVEQTINSQTVQGNFNKQDYWDYLKRHRKSLACTLMTNLSRYDIDEDDYDGIIDTIFAGLEPFMSRLIDNKERESYGETMRTTETTRQRESWSPF